jgi:hypothetical protein
MSKLTTVSSLESLALCLRAARNFPHMHVDGFTEGLNSGLDIALRAVESELSFARMLETPAEPQAPYQ